MSKIEDIIIKKLINKHIDDCQSKNLYSVFASKECIDKLINTGDNLNIKYFYESRKKIDDKLPVPMEVGTKLEELINNENLTIGIHRSEISSDIINDELMRKILEKGIVNYGDLSSGAIRLRPGLTKTVSFPENLCNTLNLLKGSYKGSTGGFVLAFPRDSVTIDGEVIGDNDKIYYEINGSSYIKPEYIVGYVDTSYGVMNFFDKEKLINEIEKTNTQNKIR